MDKKPGFIIIIVLILGTIIVFYFFLKNEQNSNTEPISAVPVNAAVIAELHQPIKLVQKVEQNNPFIQGLSGFEGLNGILEIIYSLDSIGNNSSAMQPHYQINKLIVSFHEDGNKKFETLYLLRIDGFLKVKKTIRTLKVELEKQGSIITSKYNKTKVFCFQSNNSSFYFSYQRGVLMGSTSELLLQNAIRQLESKSGIYSDKGFIKVKETAGNHVDANIYVNYKLSPNIISKIFDSEKIEQKGMNQVGEWTELDLSIKDHSAVFNGFANNTGNATHFYSLFKGQEPQNLEFFKYIPSQIESFTGFGISSYSQYSKNLQNYMDQTSQSDRYATNRKLLIEAFGENFDYRLNDIFKGEMAQVYLSGGETLFFIRTNGYRNAHELILKWLGYYSEKSGTTIIDYKMEFKLDNDSRFPIYKMPLDFFPTRLLGPWFKDCRAGYVTIYDGYIIFGDSYQSLSKMIYNNVLEKTLLYNPAFNQYSDLLSTKVNFYTFLSFVGSGSVLQDLLSSEAFAYYDRNESNFRNYYGIAWQFSNENQMVYNSLLFKFQPSNHSITKAEWETRLDTSIIVKPELVQNHQTNEKEIFVQDAKSNIYLINQSGRILWKKNIKEQIMGAVEQVDYYKNGKYQFLFNTRSQLHLIDRNGNYVEPYPKALPSLAVSSLTLVDYDRQKNYRIFVPCEDRNVYSFDIKGNSIAGFKFEGTDQPIIAPVQYLKDNDKDYLIITDSSRIYILDRKGNTRLSLENQFKASPNNQFEYQKGNSSRKSRLVRTNIDGTIHFVSFDGSVKEMVVANMSRNHYFNMEDINSDNEKEFIFVDGKKLSVFSQQGKIVFEHIFSTPILHKPAFYRFAANQTAIGITESGAQRIYLIDNKGEIMDGFPLSGITRFSIGAFESAKGYSLIVGGDEQYLYNYKLN